MLIRGQRTSSRRIGSVGVRVGLVRRGFTLVEMLVVITIIGVLIAIVVPAIHGARNAARQTACRSNLRQIGVGLMDRSVATGGSFCSGAFSWRHDGAVTEVGWVADLVKQGVPVGKVLCPGNPGQISETYNDLLSMDTASVSACTDLLGSEVATAIDGRSIVNPCRQIVESGLMPGSEARRLIVENAIFAKHYNTNYASSWFLVRSEVPSR